MRLDPKQLKKIGVLFEDDAILVVDKPAGIAVQPGDDDKRSVLELLESAYPTPCKLHLAHRLDRGTTGVLLLAKSSPVASVLGQRWDEVRKLYVAVVAGAWSGPRRIETPLETERGPVTASSFVLGARVLEHELGPLTALVVELGTGRMHQIRRHLAGLDHPVLLDDRYGRFGVNKELTRWLKARGLSPKNQLLLHAARLALAHPTLGMPLVFDAPLPEAFGALAGESQPGLGDLLADIP